MVCIALAEVKFCSTGMSVKWSVVVLLHVKWCLVHVHSVVHIKSSRDIVCLFLFDNNGAIADLSALLLNCLAGLMTMCGGEKGIDGVVCKMSAEWWTCGISESLTPLVVVVFSLLFDRHNITGISDITIIISTSISLLYWLRWLSILLNWLATTFSINFKVHSVFQFHFTNLTCSLHACN